MAFILGKTHNDHNCVYLAGATLLCLGVSFQGGEQVCASQQRLLGPV